MLMVNRLTVVVCVQQVGKNIGWVNAAFLLKENFSNDMHMVTLTNFVPQVPQGQLPTYAQLRPRRC